MPTLFAARAFLPEGWATNVRITIADNGTIRAVTRAAAKNPADIALGIVMPSFVNAHSHAFQRAMSGLTQIAGPGRDDFWTWREVMYRFASRMTPEIMRAIATHAYIEMIEGGYGHVCEFHYLHHGADGASPSEMADAIIGAAKASGIGLTLVPVLYQHGGFGKKLKPGQRPFCLETELFLDLVRALKLKSKKSGFNVGASFHSLRAVSVESIRECLAELRRIDPALPIHIHAAEQTGEVDDCLAALGRRPVEYLLGKGLADANWTLVHATHMNAREVETLARSGAVAAVCPTTEGDLGDGFFPMAAYLAKGGAIAVGSDSNVCLSPFAELRQLEWSQRLLERRRLVAASRQGVHSGGALVRAALRGGARTAGIVAGRIAAGERANLIAYDRGDAAFAAHEGDAVFDALIFGASAPLPEFAMIGGNIVRTNGRHRKAAWARKAYIAAVSRLMAKTDNRRAS